MIMGCCNMTVDGITTVLWHDREYEHCSHGEILSFYVSAATYTLIQQNCMILTCECYGYCPLCYACSCLSTQFSSNTRI